MKWRNVKLLCGIAVILLGAVLLLEYSSHTPRSNLNYVLEKFLPQIVNKITILQSTNLLTVLVKQQSGWYQTFPITFPADHYVIEALLTNLENLRYHSIIVPQNELEYTEFGLQPPFLTVIIEGSSYHSELRIGKKSPLGRYLYIQHGTNPQIMVVSDVILDVLPIRPEAWRLTTLLGNASEITRILVNTENQKFEIVKTNGQWEIVKPFKIAALSKRIEQLLQLFTMTEIVQFVDDNPEERLYNYGLVQPALELELLAGEKPINKFIVGKVCDDKPDLCYVRYAKFSPVFLVTKVIFTPWFEGFHKFWDPRIFIVNPEQVCSIEYKYDNRVVYQIDKSPTNTWNITKPYSFLADPILVQNLLSELSRWEFVNIANVTPELASQLGLDPPMETWELTICSDNFTNHYIIKLGQFQGVLRYALRNQEPIILLVPDFITLPREALFLKDRRIWSLSIDQIAAVLIKQGNLNYKWIRKGPYEWINVNGTQQKWGSLTVEETVYRLCQLWAERWVAVGKGNMEYFGFTNANVEITLQLKESGIETNPVLMLGGLSPRGRRYGATVIFPINDVVIFELPDNLTHFIEQDLLMAPLP